MLARRWFAWTALYTEGDGSFPFMIPDLAYQILLTSKSIRNALVSDVGD